MNMRPRIIGINASVRVRKVYHEIIAACSTGSVPGRPSWYYSYCTACRVSLGIMRWRIVRWPGSQRVTLNNC